MQLTENVHKLTSGFPETKLDPLTDQIQQTAVSKWESIRLNRKTVAVVVVVEKMKNYSRGVKLVVDN
jgi:ATP-dependent DNA ligase